MSNQAPIKSVIVNGNLKSGLTYNLCPISEFSEGAWNICVSAIAFSFKIQNFNELCDISCNLVKSQKFNASYEVERYNQSLNIFHLKCSENEKKNVVRFGNYNI